MREKPRPERRGFSVTSAGGLTGSVVASYWAGRRTVAQVVIFGLIFLTDRCFFCFDFKNKLTFMASCCIMNTCK